MRTDTNLHTNNWTGRTDIFTNEFHAFSEADVHACSNAGSEHGDAFEYRYAYTHSLDTTTDNSSTDKRPVDRRQFLHERSMSLLLQFDGQLVLWRFHDVLLLLR